jgi:hypothetical protein
MISQLFHSLKHRLAARLARIAVRIAGTHPAVGALPPHPPGTQIPELDDMQPAEGITPEEQFILLNSPPNVLLRKKQMTGVQPDGSIPEAAEFLKLTPAGKVLARVDFLLCDDFGVRGFASELAGRCQFCGRVAFHAVQSCPACGRLTCMECSAVFEQASQTIRLCKSCKKLADWERDNWALPSPPAEKSPPDPT